MKLRHSCLIAATHETSFAMRGATGVTDDCACHEKWLSWLILVTYETLFTMRGATGVILQRHQILRLPRKVTVMSDLRHIWNVIYNARSNRCHPPTSPMTAPATQNDCHECPSSHMKRYLQCAEQQRSSSNVTKYCACHEKWLSWVMSDPRHMWNVISNARSNRCHPPTSPNTAPATQNDSPKFHRNFSKTDETSFTMRDRSENDPSMKPSVRNPPRNRGYFSRSPRAFATEKYNISRSGYHSKFHEMLHLPRKVTFELHQIEKMALMIDPRHNARSNRCHLPTSPNTAPATKSNCHDWSSSHMKRYFMRGANLFSDESNLLRIYCQTNLISYGTLTNLFSDESILSDEYSLTNLLSHESSLRRV